MTMDDSTWTDEARSQRQRDARSAALDREVNAEIAARAERRDMALAAEAAEAERLAAEAESLSRLELEQRQATALAATAEAEAQTRARARTLERGRQVSVITRVVTYVFSLVYGLLVVRIVLALLGASPETPFVRVVHSMARPLHAPFDGIASNLTTNPDARVIVPMVVAILVAALVHAAIIGLIRLFAPRVTPHG
jgi:hypothetical protein